MPDDDMDLAFAVADRTAWRAAEAERIATETGCPPAEARLRADASYPVSTGEMVMELQRRGYVVSRHYIDRFLDHCKRTKGGPKTIGKSLVWEASDIDRFAEFLIGTIGRRALNHDSLRRLAAGMGWSDHRELMRRAEESRVEELAATLNVPPAEVRAAFVFGLADQVFSGEMIPLAEIFVSANPAWLPWGSKTLAQLGKAIVSRRDAPEFASEAERQEQRAANLRWYREALREAPWKP